MTKKTPELTTRPRERAFLVGVDIKSLPSLLSINDSLAELALLADTAGLVVVGQAYQRMDRPNAQTFIGPGKVEVIHLLVEETQAEVVLLDEELSPRHLRELEALFGDNVRILDRTKLIPQNYEETSLSCCRQGYKPAVCNQCYESHPCIFSMHLSCDGSWCTLLLAAYSEIEPYEQNYQFNPLSCQGFCRSVQ